MSIFSSFEAFKTALDVPEAHWAIDVYAPPDAEYKKIMDWACQIHTRGYQLGKMSDLARQAFRATFTDSSQDELAVFFTPTGTAANAFLRKAVLDQNKSIILCSEISHQADREAGSVEALTGSRALKPSDIFTAQEIAQSISTNGHCYLDIDHLPQALTQRDEKFLNQRPWMISLSVPCEDGTIPPLDYIKKVADFAKAHNMLFHVDGARLFVAAAALKKSLKEMTTDIGVDMLCLGGSKVGMIGVDAAVFTPHFFRKFPRLHHYQNAQACFDHCRAILKRIGGLSGRSEETSAQFARALTDGYGIAVGLRAHQSALALAEKAQKIPGIKLSGQAETNVVAVKISTEGYDDILKKKYPYIKVFDRQKNGIVVRFMSSHATTEGHVNDAAETLRQIGEKWPLRS